MISLRKWNKSHNNNVGRSKNLAIPQQPSSSSHVDPMQVNTTPRRARISEDEDDTRTVRPRLEMSALISDLCERDVPEIDWEMLGENNSSVFDIHTGLKLDEAHVKAFFETEVKRVLEFEVYEEVSEKAARGKRIWNSTWMDSQEKLGLHANAKMCLRHTTPCSDAFHFVACCVSRSWPLWDVSVAFFHAAIEEEVFVRPPKNMRKDKTIWKILKATGGTQVASSRWQRLVRETLEGYHKRAVCCIQ